MTNKLNRYSRFFLLFWLVLLGSAEAFASVGKVLLAVGDVYAKRDTLVALTRGSELLEKDVIITGESGRAQLLMIDGAKIAVRPSSELVLEEYRYTPPSEQVVTKTESSMTMNLLKGGFRTISGAIGKAEDKTNYLVKTPVATIGIRGTTYTAVLSNGLYVGVWQGGVTLNNEAGSINLGLGSAYNFARVLSRTDSPVGLVSPPDILQESSADSSDTEGNGVGTNNSGGDSGDDSVTGSFTGDEAGGSSGGSNQGGDEGAELGFGSGGNNEGEPAPEDPVPIVASGENGVTIDLDGETHNLNDLRSLAFAGLNSGSGYSFVTNVPADSVASQLGGLTDYYALLSPFGFTTEYQLNSALLFNVGYDPVTGISWGRWGQGFATVITGDGQTTSLDLTSSSLHWALDGSASQGALPLLGSASYQLVGNTDPTNNLGQVGLLGSANFFADFTNQTVSNSLSLGINGNVWNASGTGSIATGTHWFSGNYDTVTINGVSGGVGDFSGFFSRLANSEGIPAGAALLYNLQDNANDPVEIINGSLIFRRVLP